MASTFLVATQSSQAQTTFTWNATSDFWDVGSAWSPGGPPGAFDTALFNSNITDTVVWDSFTGNRTTGALQVFQGTIDFNNSGATQYSLTLGATSGDGLAVSGPTTSFTFRGLHLNALSQPVYVDNGATMTLDGAALAGTQLTSGSSIDVGFNTNSGSSAVNINSGADLITNGGFLGFSSGAFGTINVFGAGSTWTNSSFLRLGVNSGSTGILNVSAGAVTADTINIGESGTGTVLVNNNGRIKSSGLTTVSAGSSLGVDTSSGLLLVSTNANDAVGFMTNGLTVNGGTVQTNFGTSIGRDAGQTGTILLTNNASLSSNGSFYIGDFGTGVLNVQSGSDVNSTGPFELGFFGGGIGTVLVTGAGSTLTNTGNMLIGGSGTGQMTVASGGYVGSNGLTTVGAGGQINVNTLGVFAVTSGGTFSAQGFRTTGLTVNGGVVNSTGAEMVIGNFTGQTGTVTLANNATLNVQKLSVGYSEGTGVLNVEGGSDVISTIQQNFIGYESNGTATVTGIGSTWNLSNGLRIGGRPFGGSGNGQLTVADLGLVKNASSTSVERGGRLDVDTGFLVVTTNSVSTSGFLTNELSVDRGTVDATVGTSLGQTPGQTGTMTLTNNATFSSNSFLVVGEQGTGILNVQSGSDVTSTQGIIGANTPSSNGTATVTGAGSTWNNSGAMFIGGSGTGQLTVASGGLVKNTGLTTVGVGGRLDVDTSGLAVTVNASNSQGFLTNGLTVNGGVVDSTVSTTIADFGQTGTLTLANTATFNSNVYLSVGTLGTGQLNVQSGSDVNNTGTAFIGDSLGGNGTATVTGAGSTWTSNAPMFIGRSGIGQLTVASGGMVKNTGLTTVGAGGRIDVDTGDLVVTTNFTGSGFVANGLTVNGGTVDATVGSSIGLTAQTGTMTLTDNATFFSSVWLQIGEGGTGILNVQSGSDVVSSGSSSIGLFGGNGTATVTGSGSTWNASGGVYVGDSGTGQLTVANNGLVKSTGLTSVSAGGRIDVDAGSLVVTTNSTNTSGLLTNGLTVNAGRIDATVSTLIGQSGQSGTMTMSSNALFTSTSFLSVGAQGTGVLNVQSGSDVNSIGTGFIGTSGGNGSATITGSGSTWNNTGNLSVGVSGTGILNINSNGAVSVTGNTTVGSAGTVNLSAGQLATTGSLTNQVGGTVAGRGTLTASGGIQNSGTMNFNGGATTVNGNVANGSLIITGGASTTTFNNNVVHNGTEIRTLAGGSTVFKGDVSGNGNYTQTGAVTFENDFTPGTGPRIVSFGGNVSFTNTAQSFFEIAGLSPGLNGFDQLQISGNLFLGNSTLNVSLLKGFQPSIKDKFLIASVTGTVSGQFAGLAEGAQVGKTGLFITYLGFGSGNGIGLIASDRPRLLSGTSRDSGMGTGQALSAVPEPCSLWLVGLTLLAVPARRRRVQ